MFCYSGRYLYIEASNPRQPGDIAKLQSALYAPPLLRGNCTARFYYHMYGTGIGQLSLYVAESGQPERSVWMKSGDQGDMWHRAVVPFSTDSNFTVRNRAIGVLLAVG